VTTTIAAIYIKVSSPVVAETEVTELLQHLIDNGCELASDTILDPNEGYDELDSLAKWADTRTFDMVCIRRAINLEDHDAYLSFIQNLYLGNVTLLGLRGV
jgi:hypothetical protein